MNIRDRLVRRYTEQNEQFAQSREEIDKLNAATLKSASATLVPTCAGAFLFSLIVPSYAIMRLVYGIVAASMLLFLLLSLHVIKKGGRVLGSLYLMFTVLLCFSVYLSVVVSPDERATVFLGLVLVAPLLIVDKSWRVNIFAGFLFLTHTVLAFWLKTGAIPIDDAVNSAVFLIIGIYVGEGVRKTRLKIFALQRQTVAQSKVDFLTGLYNRRKMYEVTQESATGGLPITGVILLDIDHFKGFNDRYGHQAGDECLKQIGAFLREFGQTNDLPVFRFGGEEFIALARGCSYEALGELAEAIRSGIFALNIPYPHQRTGRVSVSVGYCTGMLAGADPVQGLIGAADQALYQAKNNGRNCCVGSSQTLAAIISEVALR